MPNTFPRVVITGLGALTPLGNTMPNTWQALIQGKSGAAPITRFDTTHYKTKFACELKNFDIEQFIPRHEARKLDPFAQYAIVAANEAIANAKLNEYPALNKHRIGVIWSAGIGGLTTFEEQIAQHFAKPTPRQPRFSAYFIPKMIIDIAAGHISMMHGYMGINYAVVSACASSTHALIDAFNYIRLGKANAIIAGGSEAPITEGGIGGFSAMHALSQQNDNPQTASRPFDLHRDGFVMGEGSAAIVLENLEHALQRNAPIYAEMVGGGFGADAHHLTAPHPQGLGALQVMNEALQEANLQKNDIQYINVHGTSTPRGDVSELHAIAQLFGTHTPNLNISSTKSMTGHLLGAAGALEAAITILTIQNNIIPPTINHSTPDPEIDPTLNLTLNYAQHRTVNAAISNTFGFGGHNACVAFKKYIP